MTAEPSPPTAGPSDTAALVAADVGDTTATTPAVPIAVWRLDVRDCDTPATQPGPGFLSRLARRLVLYYTRHGDTVVDFDGDIKLRQAAAATGRSYVALTSGRRVAELDLLTSPVSLAILRWPRPTSVGRASIGDLLLACQYITNADTCLLAVLTEFEHGQPSTSNNADLDELLTAASSAGMTHAESILAVSNPGGGDQYTYYSAAADIDAEMASWRDKANDSIRIDILSLQQGWRSS
jgi:hypothetical protein